MDEPIATRVTNRWAGADAVAWAAAAVGLLFREPGVLLLAAVAVVFLAYARIGREPAPELSVRRAIDDRTPTPGQELAVEVTIENVGDRTLPDVRVVDGVPAALGVLEGSPHHGTLLRSGESRTFGYTLEAERGTHEFDAVTVVCRSLDGAYETEQRVSVGTTVSCYPAMDGPDEPPLRRLVSGHSGLVPTSYSGSGVEFFGVREYRPGDRANRIDWARRARTGELATLEFREERMATAVVLIDARVEAYVRSGVDETGPHAVEWSVRAGAGLYAGLLDSGNRVGVAAIGSEFVWLAPGAGVAHRRRARELLATHPALSPSPRRKRIRSRRLTTPATAVDRHIESQLRHIESQLRHIDVHLPPDTQVFFLSPLPDDHAVAIARRLQADGHPVTVVSPDVTGGESVGARLSGIHRRRRVGALHGANVRVVDCRMDEPLAIAFERAREVWP